MKLLKPESCLWESGGGNVNIQTALGDALVFWSSDRGSTPLGSTQNPRKHGVFGGAFIFGLVAMHLLCNSWTGK